MFTILNPPIYLLRKKSLQQFKFICFISSQAGSKDVASKEINLRTKKFSEIFDCEEYVSNEYFSNNREILTLDYPQFIINANFCSKYLTLNGVIKYPYLMTLKSSLLQHRYFSLKEMGCPKPTAFNVYRYIRIMKSTPKALETSVCRFKFEADLSYFMHYLPDSDQIDRNGIRVRLEQMFHEGSCMSEIREAMNAEFLSAKLKCSVAIAHQIFGKYPPLKLQSATNTARLIDLLVQRLNFTLPEIIQAPKLLSVHYETAEYYLDNFPKILDVDIIELIHKSPQILLRTSEALQELELTLKKFNITRDQLLCCPKILNVTPKTVEERLEFLCASEDFALMKPYKKFLWLVYHYHQLNSRMDALKAAALPPTLNSFIIADPYFQNYLTYYKRRSNVENVSEYLVEYLECNRQDVLLKLRGYPTAYYAYLSNTSQVVHFLLGSGVSKLQIFNGVGIVLYDIDVVKKYFNELPNSPACQPFENWINHYNLIQLLIYTIEADHGFKGGRSSKVDGKYIDLNEQAVSA